jgi:multisubunit Na+/H+ antiporter MnhF subunit
MKTNYIFLEIVSLIACLIILIGRKFRLDIINIILFLGIIYSTYKLVTHIKKDK